MYLVSDIRKMLTPVLLTVLNVTTRGVLYYRLRKE